MPKMTSKPSENTPEQKSDCSVPARIVDLDDSMVKKIIAFNAGQRSETRAAHQRSIKDDIDSFYTATD